MKFWFVCPAELRNRGVQDVLVVVCVGLRDLPSPSAKWFDQARVQTCLIHLLRASFRECNQASLARDHREPQACLMRPLLRRPPRRQGCVAFVPMTSGDGHGPCPG
ncbi:hypothetical protein EII34_02545 [Arachnia propionica]|uniref:Mutator family transposase n=1 Tax=Arachnia propionica TaxID=1750 RepID=A0A3P1TD63_9ACTN|nr:hypothetical protein EII34_02545 [Arachnia propionica]